MPKPLKYNTQATRQCREIFFYARYVWREALLCYELWAKYFLRHYLNNALER